MKTAKILMLLFCFLALNQGYPPAGSAAQGAQTLPATSSVSAAVQEPGVDSAVEDEEPPPDQRWARLTDEQKQALLKKYEYFKNLPDSEKARLRERHKHLQRLRESLRDEEAEGEEEGGAANGRKRPDWRVRQFLNRRLDAVRDRLKGGPFETGEDRTDQVRSLKRSLESKLRERLGRFLDDLVKEGLLSPEEADSLRQGAPRDRMERLFSLGRERRIRDLKEVLPPGEEDRLRGMDPWRFHHWMRGDEEGRRGFLPGERLGALTPEQEETLRSIASPEERERRKRGLIESNLRERLVRRGVDSAEVDRLFRLEPWERRLWILKKLKTFRDEGKPLPPEVLELLDQPLMEWGDRWCGHGRERAGDRGRGQDRGPGHGQGQGQGQGQGRGQGRRHGEL